MTVEIKTGDSSYGPTTTIVATVRGSAKSITWTGGTHPALVESAVRSLAAQMELGADSVAELEAKVAELLA